MVVAIGMLNKAYNLSSTRDWPVYFDNLLVNMPTQSSQGYSQFKRIFDRSFVGNTSFIEKMEKIDQQTLRAIYCDTIPLPLGYRDSLLKELAAENTVIYDKRYAKTHVLFALLFLRSNHCNGVLSLDDENKIYNEVASLINTNDGVLDDAEVEAMALLLASGRGDLITLAAKDALYKMQRVDGSWPVQATLNGEALTSTSLHTTVLGLWFLLAEKTGEIFKPLL
jgi:hypothetical protein